MRLGEVGAHDRCSARIVGSKGASRDGAHREDPKEVGIHFVCPDKHGRVLQLDAKFAAVIEAVGLEGGAVSPDVFNIAACRPQGRLAAVVPMGIEGDDAGGVRIAQRLQEDAIDDGEHRGRGGNPHREREHGDRSESRVEPQTANGIAKVGLPGHHHLIYGLSVRRVPERKVSGGWTCRWGNCGMPEALKLCGKKLKGLRHWLCSSHQLLRESQQRGDMYRRNP